MKKITNLILILMLMFVGVIGADALTKTDLDYINDDFVSLYFNSQTYDDETTEWIYNYFTEAEIPDVEVVQNYVFGKFAWDRNYILNKEYYDEIMNNPSSIEDKDIKYQIPAEEFEGVVAQSFNVTDDFYEELRENYKPELSRTSEYRKIGSNYYYYSEQQHGLGRTVDEEFAVKGYKDLGNDKYQIYYYSYYEEYNYFESKIEYKGGNIKYLSYEEISKEDIPNDIVLYEDVIEDSNESEKEEIKEENKEETKVEINVNDKVWKEFLTELSKTSGEIKYGEDYLIYEYVSFEGKGDIGNFFTNTAKFSYKDGILKLDANNTEGKLDYLIYTIMNYMMKDSKYGEKNSLISSMFEPYKEYGLNNKFTLKNDGIEYVIRHPLTEEEQANNTCTACRYSAIFESFAIDLKNGLNMENLKKFHKGINAYKYLDGEEQTFNINEKKQLTFRIDADFKLFDGIYIDGEEVDKKYYTITEGSTVVTFTDEYSKKLGDGDHTLKVTFTDGKQAITEFKIDTKIENASTGISLGFGILTLIIIISGVGYFLIRKQSRFPKYN